MLNEVLGATVILALGIASARLYEPDHRSKQYREGRVGQIASPRGFQTVYHWIRFSTVVGGIGALMSTQPVWLAVHHEPWLMYLGLLIAIAGFALFVAAKRTLGRQYSPCFDAWLPTQIVSEGVYARVRHPIYTANLMTLFGLAFASGSAWVALNFVVLASFYRRSAVVEEAALASALPGYRQYLQRTGRFAPRF